MKEKYIEKTMVNEVSLDKKKEVKTQVKSSNHGNKRFGVLGMILALVFVAVISVGLIIVFKFKKKSTNFELTLDPMIVTTFGKNHLENANRIVVNSNSFDEKEYSCDLDVILLKGQYFEYDCKVNNIGKDEIFSSFDLDITSMSNVKLTYSVNDSAEIDFDEDKTEDNFLKTGESLTLKFFIRIIDENQQAYVTGTQFLFIQKVEVNNG